MFSSVLGSRRNIASFPEDFMFQLTVTEFDDLRRHSGTSTRYTQYEQFAESRKLEMAIRPNLEGLGYGG